jgi:hypothetical protein
MGYVIKMKHRKGFAPKYIGAVPVATDEEDDQVTALKRKGVSEVVDYENTLFDSFEEASEFPYLTAEVAAGVICTLPETKNIDYEVVPA